MIICIIGSRELYDQRTSMSIDFSADRKFTILYIICLYINRCPPIIKLLLYTILCILYYIYIYIYAML